MKIILSEQPTHFPEGYWWKDKDGWIRFSEVKPKGEDKNETSNKSSKG